MRGFLLQRRAGKIAIKQLVLSSCKILRIITILTMIYELLSLTDWRLTMIIYKIKLETVDFM